MGEANFQKGERVMVSLPSALYDQTRVEYAADIVEVLQGGYLNVRCCDDGTMQIVHHRNVAREGGKT